MSFLSAGLTCYVGAANLSGMQRLERKVRAIVRTQLFGPILERFDGLDGRLERLERRLDDVQVLLELVSARVSARAETSLGAVESEARIARRLEEVERLLGAP